MLRCCYVSSWGLGGVGWDNNVHVTCVHTWCYAAATSVVGGWVGWGGIITFMWLAYTRDATLLGWGEIITFMWLACIVRASSRREKMGYLACAHRWYRWNVENVQRWTPPAFRMYTPPVHKFPSNVWKVGGTGGQARRRKEVSRRFIHYCFWSNETWGGPALHQHKAIFGKPQKCIPLGVSCYYELSIHCELKILKCMKHRGHGPCSCTAVIWMTWNNMNCIKLRGD